MTEQFTFEQRFGQRRAVHSDERLAFAAAQIVNTAGHHFLARTVLAQYQYGQLRVSNARHGGTKSLNRRTLADPLHAGRGRIGDLVTRFQQMLVLPGVFQQPRRVRGHLNQRRLVVVGEISRAFVDQFKRAEKLSFPPDQRDTQERPSLKPQLLVDPTIDLLLTQLTIHPPRLTRLHHLPHDSRVIGNSQLPTHDPQRRPADQRVRISVPQKNAGPFRLQQTRGSFGDLLQQLVHLRRLPPLDRHPQHRLEPFNALPLKPAFPHQAPARGEPTGRQRQIRLQRARTRLRDMNRQHGREMRRVRERRHHPAVVAQGLVAIKGFGK